MNGLNNQRTNHQALCELQKLKIELQTGIYLPYYTILKLDHLCFHFSWYSQIFCSRLFAD